MNRRPLPVAPPSPREVDAGWSSIKGTLEDRRAGTLRWAWIAAAVALFVAVTAGATVLVREYRERARRARAPIEQPRTMPAEPPAPQGSVTPAPTGSGSMSPVVPAADDSVSGHDEVRDTSRRSEDARAAKAAKGKTQGGRGGAAASGAPGSPARDASRTDAPPPSYSPFAGMSPKSQPSDGREPAKPTAEPDDGVDAFAEGSAARARGDFKSALAHYEKFVAKHPRDERAGIAAMEAARILADHLEQPAKALRWAEKAAELAEGSMREDAQARVVQLLGALKRTRCATAQRDFLRDYPHSVHAARVQRACGETP